MKKLLLFFVAFALQVKLYAQAVPNGTFENWNSAPYNEADTWNSGNLRDMQRLGTESVTKVTGYAGFGIRIETKVVGADTSESYIINTDNPCSDPPQWTGGVPYSQQPTAITGYYRYNLPGNDSALLIVIFRKNGVHIGDNFILIRGNGNQPVFTSFSYPVTCNGTPDSIIIAAASSNKISNMGVQNGSFIEFDNLAFAGAAQLIPNGDFETWTAKSYDKASGWEMWGEGVSKTSSAYAGASAVRLETVGSMCGGYNSSGISSGHMTQNNGPRGGKPYSNTNDTLCGYYKYTSIGNDTAGIYVTLTNNGNPVGGNNKRLVAAANYTYFELPFQAGIIPDTIRIDAQSSEWPITQANIGSTLYLDNLFLKSSPLGIIGNAALKSSYYPNPVKEMLTVQFAKKITSIVNLYIYDVAGRKTAVSVFSRSENSIVIDVANLSTGIYFYEITTEEGIVRNKFIKE